MREWFKWVFLSLIGVVGLIAVALLILTLISLYRLNQSYEISSKTLNIPNDAATIERGRHLVEAVSACTECHGQQLAGLVFIDNAIIGLAFSSNLTPGEGGIGQRYSDVDWVNAIRHGIDPQGKPLIGMPSQHYASYSDEDLAAIIAYLKTLPPVDKTGQETGLALPGYWLFAAGGLGPLAAEAVDHEGDAPIAPEPAVTAEYGAYLVEVSGCTSCHGEDLQGGQLSPEEPPAPDITATGDVAAWPAGYFSAFMRSGRTPSGENVGAIMPFEAYGQMTDEEIEAIWLYLQSLSN